AGGTGGGLYLDLAYTVRRQLQFLGYESPDVVGLFLLPGSERNAPPAPLAAGNAFAALTELHHFSSPRTTFTAYYGDRAGILTDAAPPFRRGVLWALPPEAAGPREFEEAAARAGDFLCRELTTRLGATADRE